MSKFEEILNSATPMDAFLGEQIDKNKAEIDNKLTVYGAFYETQIADTQRILAEVEKSFQSANNYSIFTGTTTAGWEAAWYGFKHKDTVDSSALLFMRRYIYHLLRENGVWKIKTISG